MRFKKLSLGLLLASLLSIGFTLFTPTANALTNQSAITARTGGIVRNNYGEPVGFAFQAVKGATVTQLGRWVLSGNTGTHTVQIYNSSLVSLGSVTVNTSGKTAGQFSYTQLTTPVTLQSGQMYYVLSSETLGGDSWYEDQGQTLTVDTSLVGNIRSAYVSGGNPVLNNQGASYVPVSFLYDDIASSDIPLTNGVAVTDFMNARVAQGTWKYYYIDIPAGATSATFELYGMTTDLNLYVNKDVQPSVNSNWYCKPFLTGSASETCTGGPQIGTAGRWWIGVNNWTSSINNQNFTVKATYVGATAPPPPPPPPAQNGATFEYAINGRSGGTLRTDFTGVVGFKFTAAKDAQVTSLGRWVVAGNTGSHQVRLTNSTYVTLASVYVNTSGATANQFKYVDLTEPIQLRAGQVYYMYSSEVANTDSWYHNDQTITENTSLISQMSSNWNFGNVDANKSHVPLSFVFTADGDLIPPVISGVGSNNVTPTGATIIWNTDEAADSQVEYYPSGGATVSTPLDPTLATSHSVVLSGLQPNKTYNYRVKSKDARGNLRVSAYSTFYVGAVGWAWSSNIGWIKFDSGSSEPVVMDEATGVLTGYAWSSNIGWIKFGGLSNFPTGSTYAYEARVNLAKDGVIDEAISNTAAVGDPTVTLTGSGKVTGMIRACAGTTDGRCGTMDSRTDGWDGWIELSGTNHTSPSASGNGGVTYYELTSSGVTKGYLTGYAWGGEVVGWVYLSTDLDKRVCVKNCSEIAPPTPTCTITTRALPGAIEVNSSISNDINTNYQLYRGASPIYWLMTTPVTTTSGSNIIYSIQSTPDNKTSVDSNVTIGATYFYGLKRPGQSSGAATCVTSMFTGQKPGDLEVVPAISMWMFDKGIAKEKVYVKVGETAKVNWAPAASNQKFGTCKANVTDSLGTGHPINANDFDYQNPSDPSESLPRSTSGNGYEIPVSYLTRGTNKFMMDCLIKGMPESSSNRVSAKSVVTTTSDELTIVVSESSISEQ